MRALREGETAGVSPLLHSQGTLTSRSHKTALGTRRRMLSQAVNTRGSILCPEFMLHSTSVPGLPSVHMQRAINSSNKAHAHEQQGARTAWWGTWTRSWGHRPRLGKGGTCSLGTCQAETQGPR